MIITARRAQNLEALKTELENQHRVKVTNIPIDFADPEAAKNLIEQTEGQGTAIDILINNAGGGSHAYFLDSSWERVRQQIQVNLVTLTELMWGIGRAMRERGSGHILNVASIGAYTPTPTYAVYSATKAFVRDTTEAVAYELRNTGVRLCSLCPGGTATEFHLASQHELPGMVRATFMSAEDCARIGLRALFSGRRNIVSGIMNKIMMQLLRLLPRRVIVWSAALSMGEPKPAKVV